MENNIRSYNSRTSEALKRLFIPTPPQLILDVTLAVLILLSLNARAIWHYFTQGITADSQVQLGNLISERLPFITETLDRLAHSRLGQILFWLFLGCVVYLFIWLIGNFVTNIRNDIVADEYLHPKSYNRAGYWGSVLAHKVMFICTVIILLAYIFAGSKLIILLGGLCYQALLDFYWLRSSVTLLGALLVSAVVLQIFFFLLGFVRNTWQVIYRDL